MKRLLMFVFVFLFFCFPAYADETKQIPARPNVNTDYYIKWALFYSKWYKSYFVIYSTEPCTISSGNQITLNGSSASFSWNPSSSDEWVSSSLGMYWFMTSQSVYLCGNYDILNYSGGLWAAQSDDVAFTEHAKVNFGAYSDYWTESGDSGGIDLSGILSGLTKIVNAITALPSKIISGITDALKSIFIPADGFIEEKVNQVVEKFKAAFGITAFDMSLVFGGSKSVADIDVTLYGRTATIVDTSYLSEALDFFRPVIRGFIALMLFFYNFNQFLGFIGQAPLSLGAMVGLEKRREADQQNFVDRRMGDG